MKVLNSFTLQYIAVPYNFKYNFFLNRYIDEQAKPSSN